VPARKKRPPARPAAPAAAPAGFAVGLDLVDVPRFARLLARRGDALERRLFTPAERAYADKRRDRLDVLAVRVAAKEAVMKALGTGWGAGVQWTDVEVEGGGRSAPALRLHGAAAARAAALGVTIHISLTHAGTTAAAVALAVPRPA
jgi:holo-[acyl-carrier protein] synthase